MEKTAEIRNILLGNFAENEDGKLQMISKVRSFFRIKGAYPGWQATFFFGVGSSYQTYKVNKKYRKKAIESLKRIMEQIGTPVELKESSNVQSYLCNYRLSIPAVLVSEETKEGFMFTVFTGRSPTSWISRYRTFNKIKKLLPEYFVWIKIPKSRIFVQKIENIINKLDKKYKEKQNRKQEKKEIKKQKKAQRKEQRKNKNKKEK